MNTPNESTGKHAPPTVADALAEFRGHYKRQVAPPALEATVLAQMRAARERANADSMLAAPGAGGSSLSPLGRVWQQISSRWWSSALVGSLATVLLATASSPLWLHYLRESVEVATPFMLVSEPRTRELDVSQMLRVNVTREAMLDFGIPVPPERLSEQVKAEMLMGGQGEVLAVRFVEPEKKQRWLWQMF
jgi:hypothetical protein